MLAGCVAVYRDCYYLLIIRQEDLRWVGSCLFLGALLALTGCSKNSYDGTACYVDGWPRVSNVVYETCFADFMWRLILDLLVYAPHPHMIGVSCVVISGVGGLLRTS